MDADDIANAVVEKLKKNHHVAWVDPETHSQQHEFLEMLMKERADKLTRRKNLEDKIAGSVILSSILVLIGLVGAGALGWLREHLK